MCRNCGNKVKICAKYVNPKTQFDYSGAFETLFSVNVNKESTKQYLEYFCEDCKRKLDMFLKKVGEYMSDSTVIDFQPHSDTDYFICNKKTVKLKTFSLLRINIPSSQQNLGTKLKKQNMINFGWLKTSHIVNLEENRFCFSQIESNVRDTHYQT